MNNSVWIKFYENGILTQELTFKDTHRLVRAKCAEFSSHDIKKGDRVLVKITNSPLAVVTYLALLKLKAVAVPVHYKEDQGKLDFIVSNCNARAIILSDQMKVYPRNKIGKDATSLNNISTLIYTSGTTGEPKGVSLSKKNWIANTQALIKHHHLDTNTIFASPLLLSHCNAHGLAMISTYIARCKWILFDKVTPNFLDIISKEKVTILSIVPAILHQLYYVNSNWIPHKELKYILTAAAPLSAYLLEQILEQWKIQVIQGYGLSESTNFSCTLPTNLNDEDYKKVMFPFPSVGIALDDVKIKIGKDDREGITGEIFISSRSNFNGYWGRDILTPKRWVATGDLGYYKIINKQRFYYLNDRIKEIINRGGEKISPFAIESKIQRILIGNEFAIIAIPNETFGEEVGLVCKHPFDFSLLSELPHYCRPKKVFIVTNFFYTPTGKLQRKKLAEYCNIGKAQIVFDVPSI